MKKKYEIPCIEELSFHYLIEINGLFSKPLVNINKSKLLNKKGPAY